MSSLSVRLADLPEVIALFPLPGALLLPRGQLPLHIFEPRYLAMVEEALRSPLRLIGMIATIGSGTVDPQPQDARLARVGCAGRITRFHELEDGRMMISLTGICRFRLVEEVASFSPWRRARVDWAPFAPDLAPARLDIPADRDSFLVLIRRYFTAIRMQVDLDALARLPEEELITVLSMVSPFSPDDKQALLEAPDLKARRETLATLMEFALRSEGHNPGTLQ